MNVCVIEEKMAGYVSSRYAVVISSADYTNCTDFQADALRKWRVSMGYDPETRSCDGMIEYGLMMDCVREWEFSDRGYGQED